jgi:hypothetical protein
VRKGPKPRANCPTTGCATTMCNVGPAMGKGQSRSVGKKVARSPSEPAFTFMGQVPSHSPPVTGCRKKRNRYLTPTDVMHRNLHALREGSGLYELAEFESLMQSRDSATVDTIPAEQSHWPLRSQRALFTSDSSVCWMVSCRLVQFGSQFSVRFSI